MEIDRHANTMNEAQAPRREYNGYMPIAVPIVPEEMNRTDMAYQINDEPTMAVAVQSQTSATPVPVVHPI